MVVAIFSNVVILVKIRGRKVTLLITTACNNAISSLEFRIFCTPKTEGGSGVYYNISVNISLCHKKCLSLSFKIPPVSPYFLPLS